MMSRLFLLILLLPSSSPSTIDLENCTYSIDFYKAYLNLLWSSKDARSLHLQAIYSLSPNQTRVSPGQIATYSSRSVALIPFVVQCQSLSNRTSLPFTQCSSAIVNKSSRKNYESTRTNLYLKNLPSHRNLPVLYLGEYSLILSNCSFRINSTVYRLKSNETFSFQIEYETPRGSTCTSCNRRTSSCFNQTCQCRYGTRPLKLNQNQQFCIDITPHCTIDSQRCLSSKSNREEYSKQLLILLIVLIHFVLLSLLIFLWFVHRLSRSKNITIDGKHQRTPSTISTIDSIQEQYPKILREEQNGDIAYILV